MCWATRLDLKVLGKENLAPGTAVFVSNHISSYDIYALGSALDRPFRFLAKNEIKYYPVIGWAMVSFGCVFLKRDRSRRDIETLRELTANLRNNGKSVIAYAEGTRSKTGELKPFKKGSFFIAHDAGVQIIPICLWATHRVKKNRNILFPYRNRVYMKIGQPISASEVQQSTPEKLLKIAEQRVREMREELIQLDRKESSQ